MAQAGEDERDSQEYPGRPLDKAQELCWDAFESGSRKRRIELAKSALELSPDCADAYVILANEERTAKRRAELYAKGVEAGERALGVETFKSEVGSFWGVFGTRPYMRARFGLAQSLWRIHRHDDAIMHCSEMLRLNPNDNQGVRYILARYLLEVGRDSDAADILNFYESDGSADWNFTWLLITFRKEGDSAAARDQLWLAIRHNYHVPSFILGRRLLPRSMPEYFAYGYESEAMCYAEHNSNLWRKTPGGLDWLRRQLKFDG